MAKILIVDDAMFMREVIRGILTQGGYSELLEAEDGAAAVELYRRELPALVILDITMPKMDGIETLRQIKEMDPQAKVVMCSAIGQEKQIMNALALGASEYIVKPFKPDGMLGVIKKMIG